MENQIKNIQCNGCGAFIQDDDDSLIGYLDRRTLEKLTDNKQPILCKRCFRLLHYKEVTPLKVGAEDFLEVIKKIPSKVTIIAVTDIFDLSTEFFSLLKKFTDVDEILIVINKIEALPRDYKIGAVVDWVRKEAIKEKINVSYIVPTSAKNKYNIDVLYQIITQNIKYEDVYFVGNANVGKSSLINALVKSQNRNITEPAVSSLPGTTLNFLTFKNGVQTWFDTPGILLKNQSLSIFSIDDWQLILPTNQLKTIIFQLDSGQTIFIGGLAWVDFVKGQKSSFVFYFNSNISLHRKKTNENEIFYFQHVGNILIPPKEKLKDTDVFKYKQLKIKTNEKKDVVFPGIGWLTLPKRVEICLNLVDNLDVTIRSAIV
ncbi:ribosome biogenesis GTPase YqeH [Xylocopilactobacillus apis]|uniref:Ribosome biogenesis GTPase YqeH n=1 Tax=Xylocopilactobacillus apis TaxID=2932183 RepID=A0AAU9D1R9_9LACO|nr:ribosome biogenesis GTPase YqeH [Xylocopilactobacillus apis]BDR56225.1 ribosome biogenesis GTPase YqeH [Xylocopilactobacillus apis]